MITSKVTYKGELRTEMMHIRSGQIVITDAPTDNNGKGEAFSPTDTVATALGACMLTVMGIKAKEKEWGIDGSYAEVQKIMTNNPRRIETIKVDLYMRHDDLPRKAQKVLEKIGHACPITKSLHSDIHQDIQFFW